MPRFHFHLVTEHDREHVGSIDLPNRGEALPVGLQLTLKLLANSVRMHVGGDGLSIQATDDAGAVVYNFDVAPRTGDRVPSGYVH